MKTRIVEDEDLYEILGWYKDQGFPANFDQNLLPPTGVWVPGHACGWLYESDSALGWLGFPVVSPHVSRENGFKALSAVFDEIDIIARESGIAILTTAFSHTSLQRMASLKNYEVIDTDVKTMWKVV